MEMREEETRGIVFKDKQLGAEVTCGICLEVVRSPYLLKCKHRFCGECLEKSLARSKVCPNCNTVIELPLVERDTTLTALIAAAIVSCGYPACTWEGTYIDSVAHRQNECQYHPVPCPYVCGTKVPRQSMDSHMKSCTSTPCMCPVCGQQGIPKRELAHHLQECPEVMAPCERGCGMAIKNSEAAEHYATSCTAVPVRCPYARGGCSFSGTKDLLDKHIRDEVQTHLSLTFNLLCKLIDERERQKADAESLSEDDEDSKGEKRSEKRSEPQLQM